MRDEGRRTKDEGRRTKDEGRRTKDEGRGTRDEGRGTTLSRFENSINREVILPGEEKKKKTLETALH
ncbi:MAG: hypothetical protein NT004_05295 [Bacteroidetes bacterium]|nr:hypothetical protein [Bacteroidota bacterium]